MRAPPRPPISTHRLARLNAWARLWLVWFAGVFMALTGAHERKHALDRVQRGVIALISVNAAARVGYLPRTNNRHGYLHQVTRRRLAGARLRRALRGDDLAARFFAILAFVRDAESHIRALSCRLRRGLTRLRVLYLTPAAAPRIFSAPNPTALIADTS